MTNVINLNILNIFNLKVNNHQLNRTGPKRSEKAFSDQLTIDVTPSNPSISYNKPVQDNIRKVPVKISDQPEVLTCYPKNNEPGKLNAYSTHSFVPKGMYVDSYV